MINSDISLSRLTSQHIAGTKLNSARDIVAWMGAMQAQDYPMAKWALGVRLPGSTDLLIEAAVTRGEIIRTHLLRPTWHFVAAEDVNWLLDLTAPQVKAAQSSRDRDLELTEAVYSKSNSIIEKALSGGKQLTREELVTELHKAKITTDQNRASHLFARAELEKIICSGATRNNKTTYALLAERVKKTSSLSKDESLAELARRYFTSRSPATLQDFRWWSGLPAKEANHALDLVKSDFHPETIGDRTYWLTNTLDLSVTNRTSVVLLPTYDEFILSYANRSASIPADLQQHMKAISDRGVFRPIMVVNGQVQGIWTRTIKKDTMIVETKAFLHFDQSILDILSKSALQMGIFFDKKTEVFHSNFVFEYDYL